MTPTEKEDLLNELAPPFHEDNYERVLEIWEACPHNAELEDELDYYIFLHVLESHFELGQYQEANKYLDIAIEYKENNDFHDVLLKDDDNKGEYLWIVRSVISNELDGTYGMLKTYLAKLKTGIPSKEEDEKLLNLYRYAFYQKVIRKFMWLGYIIFIPKILIDIVGTINRDEIIPKIAWLNWLEYLFLAWLNIYYLFPKLLLPFHDRLMLLWLKYFAKGGREPNRQEDITNP